MSKIRLGVMGGTFDPIHFGHLVAASEAASAFGLDEVIFVPAGEPWQKQAQTSSKHRYAMTRLAIRKNKLFSISDVDVKRTGPTYTVDTLRDLRAIHPDAEFFFITGADAISNILTWKDVDKIWSLAHFVGVTRPGHALKPPAVQPGVVSILEIPALAISSTDIRDRVRSGKPIDYLLPQRVLKYIAKHHLYRGNE
jgi:nicotinate-nucleotide adenylyltransferase